MRYGFDVVRYAVVNAVPGAEQVWFDVDQDQIVLSINGSPQPFENLSAGQQVLLALVADIAIKAVTQNAYLVGRDEADHRVLDLTTGVVLIDEIDVHLHPLWQRRIIADLTRIFPSIQFAATTHSPQIIGELSRANIVLLHPDGSWSHPQIGTHGTLADEILKFVMGASAQDPKANDLEREIDRAIEDEDLERAEHLYDQFLAATEEPTIQRSRVRALVENERLLAREEL